MMKHRIIMALLIVAAAFMFATGATANAATAICYNCPPKWANWGGMLKLIKKDLHIKIPIDDKNSGQSLAQIIAEKNNPVADVVYYGVSYSVKAKKAGVVASYKPKRWSEIPAKMKDPNGYWFGIHYGTIGLFVNKTALNGKPIPKSWKDLLKPEYKGMVGYLDPSSAAVGYAGAVAINQAFGGSFNNFSPAIKYFKKLQTNRPIVPKQTAYARVLSGEIPILIDYDFNAYRAKYDDHANVSFVIPQEGSIEVPYVMSLVKNDPHPQVAERILDFVLSKKGQAFWAKSYLHPVIGKVPKQLASKFDPPSDYARAHPVNYNEMAKAEAHFSKLYLNEVR